jgi:hypothetical protein
VGAAGGGDRDGPVGWRGGPTYMAQKGDVDMVRIVCAVVSVGLLGSGVHADREVVLDAFDRGHYSEFFHVPHNTNYITGDASNYNRSFFIFDLSGIEGTVVSAEFRILVSELFTNDPFETFALHDITTPIPSVLDGTAGMAAFDDFADGDYYGSVDLDQALTNAWYSVTLTIDAIDSMNASRGLWGMGGDITTLDDDFQTTSEFLVVSPAAAADPASTQLILTIEIPAPGVLALLGAAGLSRRGWRRR